MRVGLDITNFPCTNFPCTNSPYTDGLFATDGRRTGTARAAEHCGWDMLEPGEPTSRFVESRGRLSRLGLRNVIVIPRRRVWAGGAANTSGAAAAQGWEV
jgi:hypothetical protein